MDTTTQKKMIHAQGGAQHHNTSAWWREQIISPEELRALFRAREENWRLRDQIKKMKAEIKDIESIG